MMYMYNSKFYPNKARVIKIEIININLIFVLLRPSVVVKRKFEIKYGHI